MRLLATQPLFWTFLNAALVLALLGAQGKLEAFSDPDTQGYLTMPLNSLEAALSHVRTVGYPLFLHGVLALTGSYDAAPYFQFAAYLLAVVAFCAALGAVGFSAGARGAAASVLLWSHGVFDFTAFLHPDSLALSGAIFAMACLIAIAGASRSAWLWIGLAAAIFATCQIRPAYLFLPPLVPILGPALAYFVFRSPLTKKRTWGLVAGFAAAAAGPLLVFCCLRWAVTGDFGLVSFGGYNIIGITAQLLDDELIEELSPEVRPLAQSMMQRAVANPHYEPPATYWAMERFYGRMVWEVAAPAAADLYEGDAVEMNRAMTQLSREVIQLRPRRYLRWVAFAGREGFRSVLLLFITDKGTRLALLVLLLLQMVLLARWRRSGAAPHPLPSSPQRFLEVNLLLWLALGFAIPKLLLVILVETPLHRYLAGAIIFAPPLMGVLAWHRWMQVMRRSATILASGPEAPRVK